MDNCNEFKRKSAEQKGMSDTDMLTPLHSKRGLTDYQRVEERQFSGPWIIESLPGVRLVVLRGAGLSGRQKHRLILSPHPKTEFLASMSVSQASPAFTEIVDGTTPEVAIRTTVRFCWGVGGWLFVRRPPEEFTERCSDSARETEEDPPSSRRQYHPASWKMEIAMFHCRY
jgi:hypothetical protein